VPAPGALLRRELDARGWTQADLAEITQRPAQAINEIVQGKKEITPDTAIALSAALGTSAELWLNLESRYRLHRAQLDSENERRTRSIALRGRLHRLVPVKELTRRGWIRKASTLAELDRAVCGFLAIDSADQEPRLAASFRHSKVRKPEPGPQLAWVKRVEHLAAGQEVPPFEGRRLEHAVPRILEQAQRAADAPHALSEIRTCGARVVVLEHLERSYIDGAAFWLDHDGPVVGLSLRYDRIDAFWFTLMHEVAHLLDGGRTAHLEIEGDPENDADRRAADWLVPADAYGGFLRAGRFTEPAVQEFAERIGRHPGIVVGRLQHEGRVPFSRMRKLLVPVTPHLERER
jgi:HTH-type transcriptional regulator/antitoxin HigA